MALSDHRQRSEEQRRKIAEEKMRRAKTAVSDIFESDTFKAQVAALPDTPDLVERVAASVVSTVLDPVNDYIDTLTAKGYSDPVIRRITRNIATAFNLCPEDTLYDDRLKFVAEWFTANPWAYESIDNYS